MWLTFKLVRWFLKLRRQRVVLNGFHSTWESVISGVPQRAILGPIHFLLFINDLPDIVKCKSELFADDAKIYSEIENDIDCINLQKDLDTLSEWANKWLINFNKEKFVVLKIMKAVEFDYYRDNYKLSEVPVQMNQEVLMSNDLKSSKHISHISKKNRRLGMIRRCFSNHSSDVICSLYKAIVRPIIEHNYGTHRW